MFENPTRGRQARNFTTNVPKILGSQIVFRTDTFRKLTLGAPDLTQVPVVVQQQVHYKEGFRFSRTDVQTTKLYMQKFIGDILVFRPFYGSKLGIELQKANQKDGYSVADENHCRELWFLL